LAQDAGTKRRVWSLPRFPFAALPALLALAAALTLFSGNASAHALLVRSDPVVDARLADPPTVVSAWFSESLDRSLSTMRVLDGAGEQVDDGAVTFSDEDATMMRVGLQEKVPPGFYAVVWETLSSVDGHFIKGSFPFTILNPDGSEPSAPRPKLAGVTSGGEPTADRAVAKIAGLLGAVGLLGGLAFAVWVVPGAAAQAPRVWRQRVRRADRRHTMWIVWPALGLLAVAGLAEVLVQARQLGGLDLVGKVVGETDWGERWIQRQVILGAVVAAVAVATAWGSSREALGRAALWAALLGTLGYVLLISLVSHGGAVEGSFWAVASDFVHLAAAAVWVGMLAEIGLLLAWARRGVPDSVRTPVLAAHLQRFSVLATVSVIALLASGAFSALTEIPTPEAMLQTSYGRVLVAKLALIGLLLPVAGLNAVVLRPRALSGVSASGQALERLRRWLNRAVWLEAALAVGVLAIVAVLTQYPTARVVKESEAFVQESATAVVGFEQVSEATDLSVDLSVSPNAVGTNSYQVFLSPPPGESLSEVLQVRLRFKPPDPSLGPSQTTAEEVNPNFFKAVGSFFTTAGDWEVQVIVRRAKVDDVSTFFSVPVEAGGAAQGTGSDSFALPLVTGSWATVAAVALLAGAVIVLMPAQQWPRIHVRAARWLRMTSVTCVVFGLALLFGVQQHLGLIPQGTSEGNPVPATEASVARGRELFAQNCARCHGETGRGNGPDADTLPVPPADFKVHIPFHTDLFFFQVITGGFGDAMPAFGDQISEEDRWNLINFLKAEFSLEGQQQ
jgi:copper transport protein